MADNLQTLLEEATAQLAACSETARLDAEVLLCHCLQKSRVFLRSWPEHQPDSGQIRQFLDLVKQRQLGHPVAYLTGHREFWSRQFNLTPDVLIPRPDSELLIELSLALLGNRPEAHIIDLGTGSGILAITLAAEMPKARVVATDISPNALQIARANAERLQVDNVHFMQSHWFDAINESDFDLVVSNPPYIAASDPHLQQGDLRFEPATALVSAENGLADIRQLADQARRHLKSGGHLLIEHGYNQQAEVQQIFAAFAYRNVETHRDLAGNPRVTSGLWNPV